MSTGAVVFLATVVLLDMLSNIIHARWYTKASAKWRASNDEVIASFRRELEGRDEFLAQVRAAAERTMKPAAHLDAGSSEP